MDTPAEDAAPQGAPLPAARISRRTFLGAAAGAGAGGLLAACGSSTPTKQTSPTTAAGGGAGRRAGGDLKVGLTGGSGTDTLDPHKGLTYLDTARAQSLYSPLLQLDTDAQTELVLAEEIAPHGSTSEWVIRLRSGVTFHSGKPLTADDVIFTFQRIIGEKLTGSTSLGPIDVKALKKLDDLTVLVPMTSPYGSFIDQLSYWYYLYIVPTGYDPKSPPDGTGPFAYKSFTPGQQSVFVKNPHYWKPNLPYVDSLTIIDFSDSVSLQNALTTGLIDGAGALEGAQMAELSGNAAIRTVTSHTGAITPFTMRVDQKPFSDVNVRQALRFIVDRPQLVADALGGFGVVGYDVFSPYDPNYDSALHREQDIGLARSLLRKGGQEGLNVRLVTSAVSTGTVAMATVLAQQAKAAGVTISLDNVSPTVFFGPDYLHWTFSQDFYNYSPYLAQVAQSMLPTSPFNETHWDNPRYNSLYAEANATLSAGLRKEIEHEMQLIDFNEGGYIIPAFIDALDAYSAKLRGYGPAKVGQPLSDFDFEHFSFA
ncbi:MAG: ABC transporter substrate-binding protein [Acidimicrobiales bacterium]